ncbi:TspO/MBR family protein [Marinactinospora thermotolerans]|uniref:TspO and MBR related proteins n=1 Tax=Marinactinospora thermotolerans DSM 45154 TaxID=1122192 RepID=A0A1T4SN31_9ACTN|nr:TspO/MBR family protein [Marinactinospora thermotolerans]SKA29639.1 TspO and MBR related proteins [Marinactinospora thermotolerans DSM 45154]
MADRAPSRSRQTGAAVAFALAVLATAAIGGAAASGSAEVYARLTLPSWAPPQWLFGPAWTVLYVLMALAGWLVWRSAGLRGAPVAFALYALQLLLNAAWTPLFFAAGRYGAALVDITVLGVALAVLIALFARHSRVAAVALVPYLVWVAYAGALNGAIVVLN